MRKILYILVAGLSFALASCTFEEASYFETGSAQRANKAIEDYTKILTSAANGWVMHMYPEVNQSYGGFNVLCKFSADGKVTVASPVTGEYYEATSFYTVKQSAGIVLSFDSYNEVFHLFSDPEDPFGIGGAGYGLEGDYDYLVLSASSEKVALKGKKSGSYCDLVPAPADWEGYFDEINESEEKVCAYSKYVLHVADSSVITSLNYYSFSFSIYDNDIKTSVDGPFVITPEGCTLYQPLTIYGKTISGFITSETSEDLICTDDPAIYLTPYVAPLNEQLATGDWFIAYKDVSAAVKASFDIADNAVYASEGEKVAYLGLCDGSHMLSKYSSVWGLFFFMNVGYAGQYEMGVTYIDEDKIKLEWTGGGQGDYNYYRSNCKYDYFVNVFGNTGKAKTFTLTTDNPKHPSYMILTDDSNPEITVKLVPDLVPYK